MAGKFLVLKAIVLPVLLYVGRVFPPDKATGELITRLAFRFVWGRNMEKLKRVTLLKKERNGGWGVPDIVNIIMVQGLAALVQNTGRWVRPLVPLPGTMPPPSFGRWAWACWT